MILKYGAEGNYAWRLDYMSFSHLSSTSSLPFSLSFSFPFTKVQLHFNSTK